MSSGPARGRWSMTAAPLSLTRVGTVVVPVVDQEAALAFYCDVLGMAKVNDFAYQSGERWLEVSPGDGSSNLCLVSARPERPAGIETGVVLLSTDVPADLAALREAGVRTDATPSSRASSAGGAARPWRESRRSSGSTTRTATRSWWSRRPDGRAVAGNPRPAAPRPDRAAQALRRPGAPRTP